MGEDQKDPNAPYLPDRYKRYVKAKKRRHLFKKAVAFVVVLALIIVLFLAMGGTLFSTTPQLPATAAPSPLSSPTLSQTPSPTSLSVSATQVPAITGTTKPDAAPSTPVNAVNASLFGQDNAKITEDRAQYIALTTFPMLHANRVTVQYRENPEFGRVWNFTLYQNTTPLIMGSLDPATGQVLSFARTISGDGRAADPVLSVSEAQNIADGYISDRNGPLGLNMSSSRYVPLGTKEDPAAGSYKFVYNRIVQDIPCDWEGFTIDVDSVTGEVTGYIQRWNIPDNAFAPVEDPHVPRYEATFAVLQRAQATSPSSVAGLQIISAEITWKDRYPIGSIPRPGSIPLAWKIQFDDNILRSQTGLSPGVGWVDTKTGEVLDFEYQH